MKKLASNSSILIPAHKLVFFLVLFFLPQQFGPHFWPAFSYVQGIRIDYLSPTVYICDILIIVLFLISWRKVFISKLARSLISSKVFLLLVLVLLVPFFYTKSPTALLFGIIKLFEFGYLGLYTATQVRKADIPQIIGVLALAGFLESSLSIIQFFKQSSVGGFFYFFGERSYNLSTIGIAAMNTASGLIVRPYGTFPHPNVLACFLFTVVVLTVYQLKREKNRNVRLLLSFSFSIMQLALLLTFSRIIIFFNIIFLLYVFLFIPLKEKVQSKKNIIGGVVLLIFFVSYLLLFNLRFFDLNYLAKDLIPRKDLNQISLSIIINYPITGTGLNNFFYYEAPLQKHFTSYYLQPVHNIFLLIMSETGMVGFLIFGYFLAAAVVSLTRSIKKSSEIFSFQKAVLILLASIIIAGLFDHYFLTVQQGELLFAFILGLSFSRT